MSLRTMFYNFQYNYGHEQGQPKYAWGIDEFDLEKPLVPQLVAKTGFHELDVFNVNLTAFNPVITEQTKVGE